MTDPTIDTMDPVALAKAMTPVDFAALGLGAVAYVRPVRLPDGSGGLSICDAAGRTLAVAESVMSARAMADDADLSLVTLQ
jgi:hypothetical protein